jgi:hypothetical protein
LKGNVVNKNPKIMSIRFALAAAAGLAASTIVSHAQGIQASATLVGVPGAGNTYDYTLTLSDAPTATTSIEGFWYAWIPGFFFLPTAPTSPSGDGSGWTASDFNAGGHSSIQFQGNAGNAIAPGYSASFTFVSTDSPATLAGMSQGYPIGDSVAYPGTINFSGSSPNETFVVMSIVPEPSTVGLLIAGSIGWLAAARRKVRV